MVVGYQERDSHKQSFDGGQRRNVEPPSSVAGSAEADPLEDDSTLSVTSVHRSDVSVEPIDPALPGCGRFDSLFREVESDDSSNGMLVTCIDPRLRIEPLLGENQSQWFVYRVPGCAITPELTESVRWLVREKGVAVVVFLKHTDCAADKLAATPLNADYATLQSHGRSFDEDYRQLTSDPELARYIEEKRLIFRCYQIDICTGEITEGGPGPRN